MTSSVVHTHHPEITEPINVACQDMKQINNFFEVSHIDLFKDPTLNNTVCNVQPSQKSAPRVFPPLPYSKHN